MTMSCRCAAMVDLLFQFLVELNNMLLVLGLGLGLGFGSVGIIGSLGSVIAAASEVQAN